MGTYPKNVEDVLEISSKNTFNNMKTLLEYKHEANKILVIFTDDIYNKSWVIELTDWKHPHGIGPTTKSFNKKRLIINITSEFNRQAHMADNFEELLLLSIGVIQFF
jgi:hypothetical protein